MNSTFLQSSRIWDDFCDAHFVFNHLLVDATRELISTGGIFESLAHSKKLELLFVKLDHEIKTNNNNNAETEGGNVYCSCLRRGSHTADTKNIKQRCWRYGYTVWPVLCSELVISGRKCSEMKRSMFEMFQWHKSRYFTGRWEHFCAWRELFVHMPNQGLWCAAWEEVETKVLRHEFRRGSAFIGQTLKSGTTAYLIANLFWDEDLKHVHCVNAETHRSSDKHEQPASLVFVQFATFDGLKDEKTHNHLRLIVLKWISFTLQSSWWRRQMWLPRKNLAEYKFKAEIGAVNRNFTAVKRRNWGQEQIHRLKKKSQPHERHQLEKWKPWEQISLLSSEKEALTRNISVQRWKMEEVEATCFSHKTAGITVAVESRSSSPHWQKEMLNSWLIFHAGPFWDRRVISAVKRRNWRLG